MFIEGNAIGGGGSSNWSSITGIPTNINTLAGGGTPSAGQMFQWTGPATGHFIATPTFTQNFNYSALTSVPGAVSALSSLTPAAGQIVEYTGSGSAHMIPTPSGGGGGGPAVPGTTHIGSLVTWNSLTGAAIADPNVIPSANGYSFISSANYASMRGLLSIGSVGLLNDISTIVSAGSNITISTTGGVTTINSSLPPPASTWNPGDKSAAITLSSGNLVATKAGLGSAGVRATTSQSSGKYHFEITIGNAWNGGSGLGIALGTASLSVTIGQAGSAGYQPGGSVTINSISQTPLSGYGNGDIVAVEVDFSAQLIYFQVLGGGRSSGYSIASIAGADFPAVCLNGNGDTCTVNFGASSFAITPTSGFIAWGYGGGSGISGVTSVNGRSGAVTLTSADVATNFGSEMNTKLIAGTGVTTSYNSGTDQLTINATGTSGVATFNGRSGAVSFVAGDVYPVLSAGTGISLSNLGATVQITASGGGGVPIGYNGAAENSILTSNSASVNTTNLNNLISTVNAAGGGKIWFNGPGNYNFNGTINLMSNVDIWMTDGAILNWTGSTSGTCFASPSNAVLTQCDLTITVNEGSGFTGVVFAFHSAANNKMQLLGLGTQTAAGVFFSFFADSSAGIAPYPGLFANRNSAGNQISVRHFGICGYGMLMAGITSGYGGQPQVVTDNTFINCQFTNVAFRGIKINEWSDSNTFIGNTYIGLSTGANSIGIIINEGHTNNFSVYNTLWQHVAIDIFGSLGGRSGVVFFESKGMTIEEMFIGPTLETGDFVANLCTSYNCQKLVNSGSFVTGGGVDTFYIHQKNVTVGP